LSQKQCHFAKTKSEKSHKDGGGTDACRVEQTRARFLATAQIPTINWNDNFTMILPKGSVGEITFDIEVLFLFLQFISDIDAR
jgi:hypothetical protein